MLPKLDADQIITVYMTLDYNPALLIDNPPLMKQEVADIQAATDIKLSASNSARFWDIYKEVVQLSFSFEQRYYHFLLCDSYDEPAVDEALKRTVMVFSDEESLIRAAFDLLWRAYGGEQADGKTLYYRVLSGWQTHSKIWPALANRALRYHIKAPSAMLTDPERRWPTTYGLVDLSTIYSQAIREGRYNPGLADVLRYWGFWTEDMGPMPADMRAAVCSSPSDAVRRVEPYLEAMNAVMKAYYEVPEMQHIELAGQPIPPALPPVFIGA